MFVLNAATALIRCDPKNLVSECCEYQNYLYLKPRDFEVISHLPSKCELDLLAEYLHAIRALYMSLYVGQIEQRI